MQKENKIFNMIPMHVIFSCLLFVYITVSSQPTLVSRSGCSYTFLVSKQDDNSCPLGSVASGPNNEEVQYLKSVIKNQQDHLSLLSQSVFTLQEELKDLKESKQADSSNTSDVRVGTNYVRWGRTVCPQTAQLLYQGFAAKSHFARDGGGVNYLCLHSNPQWRNGTRSDFEKGDRIHGVEYEILAGLDTSLYNNDAPCSVCHVDGRGEHLMIPAQRSCPQNWTKEYEGLLVTDHNAHKKATYVCLDHDPEVVPGGSEDKNGALFYTVEAVCSGALPCPPYRSGCEIACVVCTY